MKWEIGNPYEKMFFSDSYKSELIRYFTFLLILDCYNFPLFQF